MLPYKRNPLPLDESAVETMRRCAVQGNGRSPIRRR